MWLVEKPETTCARKGGVCATKKGVIWLYFSRERLKAWFGLAWGDEVAEVTLP